MRPKFTPGPWRRGGLFGTAIYLDRPNVTSESQPLAEVILLEEPAKDGEAVANARLMAAAPELYRALERATGTLERTAEVTAGSDLQQQIDRVLPELKRVLAKARGEAP